MKKKETLSQKPSQQVEVPPVKNTFVQFLVEIVKTHPRFAYPLMIVLGLSLGMEFTKQFVSELLPESPIQVSPNMWLWSSENSSRVQFMEGLTPLNWTTFSAVDRGLTLTGFPAPEGYESREMFLFNEEVYFTGSFEDQFGIFQISYVENGGIEITQVMNGDISFIHTASDKKGALVFKRESNGDINIHYLDFEQWVLGPKVGLLLNTRPEEDPNVIGSINWPILWSADGQYSMVHVNEDIYGGIWKIKIIDRTTGEVVWSYDHSSDISHLELETTVGSDGHSMFMVRFDDKFIWITLYPDGITELRTSYPLN